MIERLPKAHRERIARDVRRRAAHLRARRVRPSVIEAVEREMLLTQQELAELPTFHEEGSRVDERGIEAGEAGEFFGDDGFFGV